MTSLGVDNLMIHFNHENPLKVPAACKPPGMIRHDPIRCTLLPRCKFSADGKSCSGMLDSSGAAA